MTQAVPIARKVMVLGATPEAGCAVAALLELGYAVDWVLLEDGGAVADSEPERPGLAVHRDALLAHLDGAAGSFVARLGRDDSGFSVETSAVIVAAGNARFFPGDSYGLTPSAGVISLEQLQRRLENERLRTSAAADRMRLRTRRVALVLGLKRDVSREMTFEALHWARRVFGEWGCEVTVFYRELSVDTPGLEHLTLEMRREGIVFARYGALQLQPQAEEVALFYEEGAQSYDLLVLPEAIQPRADTAELAEALGLRPAEDGYLEELNIHLDRPGLSSRRGVFLAGRCHVDATPDELRADALQAVAQVDALIGDGRLAPEEVIAHVEAEKCIRCLTCLRTCPHAAVEVVPYEGVIAARVMDLACQGCGQCVTNCPARAIELIGQAYPAWMSVQ
ncbi:MAG: 4Fe-4S binding protein [Anaerolineae bacterium]|nr:4Fe-4S binding protein [Anaerolineae bacterium]